MQQPLLGHVLYIYINVKLNVSHGIDAFRYPRHITVYGILVIGFAPLKSSKHISLVVMLD